MTSFFDQDGLALYLPTVVSRVVFEPFASMMKICGDPARSETKAIFEQSGDHTGDVSMARFVVNRRKSDPSLAIV